MGTMTTLHEETAILDFPDGRVAKIPSYANLPSVPGLPYGCTWGLWDNLLSLDKPDELATLNPLTPKTVPAVKPEIQHGISVAINWSFNNYQTPHSSRRPQSHKIMTLKEVQGEEFARIGHDDEVSMNTESGSQWDGFREFQSPP